jgi:hypothetical protein
VGPIRTATCRDWNRGSADQRYGTIDQLHRFAGGPVGSSPQMQNGQVLDDARAYRLIQGGCSKPFARAFKLYKLYERAASFTGHQAGSALGG